MAKSSLQACAALTPVLILLAGTAAANEVRCERADDAVRRVVIEVEDPNRNVPCEVVYWKDTEEPGVREVLWNAQTDAGFCERKAAELVGKLEAVGWSCAATDSPTRSATRPAPDQPSREASGAPATAETDTGPDVAAPAPEQAAPAAEQPRDAPAMREALAPQRAAVEPQAEVDPGADLDAETRSGTSRGTALDAIIEQNVVRLNDGVDGQFAAEIAQYGDLDGDGLDDGLVFFTYESERLGQARFVAAYLYDGESYALAATKPLAGSDDNVQSAEIESIDDGVISLRLNVLEPGDASCCPSGTRRQNLVLRGGQLVEDTAAASQVDGRS